MRAALDPKPHRDLATSRRGTIGYAFLRHLPRKLVDRATVKRLRSGAARGHFDESEMAAPMPARLTSG